jgi:hypothetical protein
MKYRLLSDTPFHKAGSIFQSEGELEQWEGIELLKCKCDVTGSAYDFPTKTLEDWLDPLPEEKYYVSLDANRITYYKTNANVGLDFTINKFDTEDDAKEAVELVSRALRKYYERKKYVLHPEATYGYNGDKPDFRNSALN